MFLDERWQTQYLKRRDVATGAGAVMLTRHRNIWEKQARREARGICCQTTTCRVNDRNMVVTLAAEFKMLKTLPRHTQNLTSAVITTTSQA